MPANVRPVSGQRRHALGVTPGPAWNPQAVTRAELIALASPLCHTCGAPVLRIETRWHVDEDDRWRPGPYFMVCGNDHRVIVKPLT